MNKRTIDAIPSIVVQLNQKKTVDAKAFMGFDACIDNVVHVVKNKKENSDTGYYTSSRQLGEFLVDLDNKSCGFELQTRLSKIGGNMVITGNVLGNPGIRVECVGTFGHPEILSVFRTMSARNRMCIYPG